VYTASVQKIIQEQKKVRRSGPKKKKQWNILWLNERGAGRNRQGFGAHTKHLKTALQCSKRSKRK
jgi:hypothetical protein